MKNQKTSNKPTGLKKKIAIEKDRKAKLAGEHLKENAFDLTHGLHAGVNKIYSNVRQITHNPRAAELDADAVRRLNYLADKLCEQVYLLSNQK